MYSDLIHMAVRQIERWMIAARQDRHPAIKLLHSNYAVADVDMLRQAFTDEQIKQSTGKDARQLYRTAISLQDEAQRELTFLCPQAVPDY